MLHKPNALHNDNVATMTASPVPILEVRTTMGPLRTHV